MTGIRAVLCVAVLFACGSLGVAQVDITLPLVGKIKPRSSQEIVSSNWSIGGETQDRDYAIYDNYKTFLSPLGAKHIRLQTGWAKCEKEPGVYDFAWLDKVVNDAISQHVQPWLELNYGNPIYPGGGDIGLNGGFPTSPEAAAAWDRWVRATVEHFKDRVYEWEVWNEPDGNRKGSAEAYSELFIRTASIIREVQPRGKSRIYALALAHNLNYADKFLTILTERKKLDLVDSVTVHGYPQNPDNTEIFDKLRERLDNADRSIELYEGETGAPSKYSTYQALNRLPWTENMQAKYDLRRMLVFYAKQVPFNLFSLMDMDYVSSQTYQFNHGHEMNYFGLLAAREEPSDKTVVYAKPSYYATQNVLAIFDDSFAPMTNVTYTVSVGNSLAKYAYKNKSTGAQILALWFNGAMPSDSNAKTLVDITPSGMHFNDPVYVDLLTGKVFALSKSPDDMSFKDIPLYDSPILIAERAALPINMKGVQYCKNCDGQTTDR